MGSPKNPITRYALILLLVFFCNELVEGKGLTKNPARYEIKRSPIKRLPVSNSVQDLIDLDGDDYPIEDIHKLAIPRSSINEAHAEFHSPTNNAEPENPPQAHAKPQAPAKHEPEREKEEEEPPAVTEKKEESVTAKKISRKYKNKEGDAFGKPHRIVMSKDDGDLLVEMEVNKDPVFTSFTISNTDIGIDYSQLPYRERYQWNTHSAPCHSFKLKVPDELVEESIITPCIFRPTLQFPDETKVFILDEFADLEQVDKPSDRQVAGYVMNTKASMVRGRVVDSRYFYGEVFILDPDTNISKTYIAEEIHLLNKLLSDDPRTLKNMLRVMHAREEPDSKNKKNSTVYNAVVTSGASLNHLMVCTNPSERNVNQFFILTTAHISYICPGDPTLIHDESGKVNLICGQNEIIAEKDGSVFMSAPGKKYIFRPNGRTILQEGQTTRTLQEHEGSVAITAYSSSTTYDCVLPTPAFQPKRKGAYVCRICIAADELFREYLIDPMIHNNTNLRLKYLAHVIDRVSWLIRGLDYNGDAKPDNIGIVFDDVIHDWKYTLESNADLEHSEEEDMESLFRSMEFDGEDFADCCLGIALTMKRLPGDALARRPPAKGFGPTGICTGRVGTGRTPNNLIIITGNSYKDSFIPVKENQLVYLIAHEILGAFGAVPDGAGDDGCDEFMDIASPTTDTKRRHFLMWPDVLRETSLREQRLSKCSKRDLVASLLSCRSSCFGVDLHPFCGNGVVEEGEECDCGSEYDCKLQTCCDARSGKHPCKKTGLGCTSSSSLFLPSIFVTTFSLILSAYVVLL